MTRRRVSEQLPLLPAGPHQRGPQMREVQVLLESMQDGPIHDSALTRTAQRRCARECEGAGLVVRDEPDLLHATDLGRSLLAYLIEHGPQGLRLKTMKRCARQNLERDAAEARR